MGTLNRRQFLQQGALTIAVTSTCLCSISGCATATKIGSTPAIHPESFTVADKILTIDLSKEAVLGQVGGAVKITHPDIPDGMILAHVDENRFEVASLRCTHRGVEVEYQHSQQQFKCASLGGATFTLEGHNIKGPAKKPLQAYEAVLEEAILRIAL